MSQNLIDLSNYFLTVTKISTNINIGFISLFSESNTNTVISGTSLTTRKIIISSLLEFEYAFLLTSQIINPLNIITLGKSFYQIYKASQNISSAFTDLFSQLLSNINDASTIAYSQTSSNIISISSSYQQSVIALKNIISNFNLLSSKLFDISTIILSIDIINNDVLSKAISAASDAAQQISLNFNVFYTDFYIVSTTFIPGINVVNQLNLIPINFSIFSIAFQQAYLICSVFNVRPNPVSSSPLSIAFNNLYIKFLNIANLFNDQDNINNSIYIYASSGLIKIFQIVYYQFAIIYQYTINPETNTELFTYYNYNKYISTILGNVYLLLNSELNINFTYTKPFVSNIILNMYNNYEDITNILLIIINDLQDIKYIINSPSSFKNALIQYQNTFIKYTESYLEINNFKSKYDLLNSFNNIATYHLQFINELLNFIPSVLYPVPESLNITYPNIDSNILSNPLNNISLYFKNIAQEFQIIFISNNQIQSNLFNNIVNALYILSNVFIQASVNLSDIPQLYTSLYQIYTLFNNLSILFSFPYDSNLTVNYNIPPSSSLSNNFSNLSKEFISLSNINLPFDCLSSCFSSIANISNDISNIFEKDNLIYDLINYLNIKFQQYTQIWNIAYISIYYLSSPISTISPTSFSSSLLSASNSCKNISKSYNSIKNIESNIYINFDSSILNYDLLSYLFMNASNSTSEIELSNAFQQINTILSNEQKSFEMIVNVSSYVNLFPNNDKTLYILNNLISNFNLFSSSISSASSTISNLQFTIKHPLSFSIALDAVSLSISEISNGYTLLITSLDNVSIPLQNILIGNKNLSSAINQAYISITSISPKIYNGIIAVNAPFDN